MTGSWWSPRGRISRRGLALLYHLPAGICAMAARFIAHEVEPASVRTVWLVYLAVWAWPLTVGLIKRLHDCDHSAAWALLALIPIAGEVVLFLVMYVAMSEGEANRFGPPPFELRDAPLW
jgi:uncharacterized membrane protein YhaH (DUF805 family)